MTQSQIESLLVENNDQRKSVIRVSTPKQMLTTLVKNNKPLSATEIGSQKETRTDTGYELYTRTHGQEGILIQMINVLSLTL